MGFFSISPEPQSVIRTDGFTYDEDYIKKALRLPSAGNDYENKGFNSHFIQKSDYEKLEQASLGRRSHRFSRLFRSREKRCEDISNISTQESCPSLRKNEKCLEDIETYSSVRNNILETNGDVETTSIQDSNVHVEPIRRHMSIRIGWRSKGTRSNNNQSRYKKHKRLSVRNLFFRAIGKAQDAETIKTPLASSSVYDVQETLTQRYMNDSNGYSQLFEDMDAIPFDLTVKNEHTIQQKVTKAIQSWSPMKKSPAGNTGEAYTREKLEKSDINENFEDWNPYGNVRKTNQVDRISITSSEIELSKKYNVNLSVQRRQSKIGSFTKNLSIRAKEKLRCRSFSNTTLGENNSEKEEESNILSSFSYQKETLSSLFGPDISTLSQNELDKKVNLSSDSCATAGNGDSYAKLYEKSFDAADNKQSSALENLSGSTKISNSTNLSLEKSKNSDSVISSIESANKKHPPEAFDKVVVNFATIHSTTYDSENVSSFLQDFYEPSRPVTKDLSAKPSVLKRSNTRAFANVRKNPLDMKESEDKRPLTAVELFQKQRDETKKELNELTFLIKRDRSHHRKVVNGLLT